MVDHQLIKKERLIRLFLKAFTSLRLTVGYTKPTYKLFGKFWTPTWLQTSAQKESKCFITDCELNIKVATDSFCLRCLNGMRKTTKNRKIRLRTSENMQSLCIFIYLFMLAVMPCEYRFHVPSNQMFWICVPKPPKIIRKKKKKKTITLDCRQSKSHK